MIARPGTSPFIFRKPATASSVPTPTVYWEANFGVVTTTNGTTADSSPVSGNKVLSWTSKDASATVASYGTNANRPTYYAPTWGKPYLTFDGTQNQRLETTGFVSTFNNAQQYTMGVSLRTAAAYSGYRNESYLWLNSTGNSGILQAGPSGAGYSVFAGGVTYMGGTRTIVSYSGELSSESTLFASFSTTATGSTAASSITKIYFNGALVASDTASTATPNYCDKIIIGGTQDTSSSKTKDYYGVYLYSTQLSDAQVATVHSDISSRLFTLSLPVSGAALWLDGSRQTGLWDTTALGSNVYSNGGAIGQWNDLSGNSKNAIAGTTAYSSTNRPTWNSPAVGLNGLGTLKFNGTSNYMFIPASSYSAYTLFIVAQNNDLSNGSVLLGKSSGSTDYVLMGSVFRVEMTSTSDQINTARTNNTAWNYLTCKYDGSSGTPYVNGVIGTVKTGISGSTLDSNCIGYYATASYILDGQIAELVLFNSALNDTDRASVESYLKAKWGL
jgi:hypothetical protein